LAHKRLRLIIARLFFAHPLVAVWSVNWAFLVASRLPCRACSDGSRFRAPAPTAARSRRLRLST